jgi:hypothetical protein
MATMARQQVSLAPTRTHLLTELPTLSNGSTDSGNTLPSVIPCVFDTQLKIMALNKKHK